MDALNKPNVRRGATYYAIIATVLGIITAIPVLGCIALPITCVVGLLLPFAIGWLVAQWGSYALTTTTMGSVPPSSALATPGAAAAMDGGIATAAGALVSGI